MRKLLLLVVVTACLESAVAQKTAGPLPEYDAAVIKVNKTLSHGHSTDTDDTTFQATNVTLKRLMTNAFGVREGQISGLPGWAESMSWDVNAKVTDPDMKVMQNLSRVQRQQMLANLLIERFHLKTHIEVKTLPVYELVVAKGGPKLTASRPATNDSDGDMSTNNTDMKASGVKLGDFVVNISTRLDRTVIDKTGLTGRYDFELRWSPDEVANGGKDNGAADAPPGIFTAIEEQMGLKLQPGKGPVNTIVVDSVEQPTEN